MRLLDPSTSPAPPVGSAFDFPVGGYEFAFIYVISLLLTIVLSRAGKDAAEPNAKYIVLCTPSFIPNKLVWLKSFRDLSV